MTLSLAVAVPLLSCSTFWRLSTWIKYAANPAVVTAAEGQSELDLISCYDFGSGIDMPN